MNESCHIYDQVMSHIWMSHATHMNESCHTMNQSCNIRMSHVMHTTTSCCTYERVTSHLWTSHVAYRLTNIQSPCNTLQHTATRYNTQQHTATHSNILQHTATHCNTLQHTATRCNTKIWDSQVHRAITGASICASICKWESRHICQRVTSHMWTSHVTHANH